MYAAGPGDVIGTFENWKAGRDDPSQVSVTYSGQFFDVCRAVGAESLTVSQSKRALLVEPPFRIEQIEVKPTGGGWRYHWATIIYGLRIIFRARRFRADALIVAEGLMHWFMLWLAPRRCLIIPTLHCLLWLKDEQPGFIHRRLNRRFFERRAFAVMTASDDISRQVRRLTHGEARPIYEFLPTYRREMFSGIAPPSPWGLMGAPFRVFFAGRVEANKGVNVLLDLAEMLSAEEPAVEFDLCGTGSALEALRESATRKGLSERFRCHGHCNRESMRKMFEDCHAVIVPTTREFNEGFNQVVAEAVLAGRPVITSSVCPALSYVREAVMEVPPDSTVEYAGAIRALANDPELYEAKRAAASRYQEQFYAPDNGWASTLLKVLALAQKRAF